jgi:hypothetical protein
LLFAEHFVETANGFFEFATQAFGALGVRLRRELAGTAGTSGTGAIAATACASTFHTGRHLSAAATTATGRSAGFAAAFHLGRLATAATAQAFTGLAHATDTARQRTRVSTLAATFTVSVAAAFSAAFTTFAGLAAAPFCAATVTAAHAGHFTGHREFDLRHTAYAAALSATRGTTPARGGATAR